MPRKMKYEPGIIYANIPEPRKQGENNFFYKNQQKICYYLQEMQCIFFSNNDHTKLSWCCIFFLKCKVSFMKEFQSHCGQFNEMRKTKTKNSPKVGKENNYLLTKRWDVLL